MGRDVNGGSANAGHGQVGAALRSIGPHVGFALAFSAAVNVLFLASPIYMMQLYGRVLNSRSLETLASLSLVLALVLIAMAAADAARGRLLARAGGRMAQRLTAPAIRVALMAGKGRAQSTLEELEVVRKFFAGGSMATLMDTPFTVLFLFVLFLLHPALGLVATVGAALILATVWLPRLVEVARERRIADGARSIDESATLLSRDRGEIRGLGLDEGLAARLSRNHLTLGATRLASGEGSATVGATARFWRLAAHSAALATGAVLAIDGALAPSAMLAAAILTGRALGPIETLPVALRHARLSRRALEGLDAALERAAPLRSEPLPVQAGVAVEARRVVVTPTGATRPALRSLSCKLAPGEVVAVVGEAGAGKSTLLRCLAGVEPVKSGELRIGSVDVASADPQLLQALVGWMPQDPPLFPGTVRENVARFLPLPEEDVRRAIRRAGALEAIEKLPHGFETDVGSPSVAASPNLRQQIALARSLVGDAPLILLDQPTAHMDAAGEVATLNAIRALKGAGVTVIVASHKPVMSTVADRIMLLSDGLMEVFEDRDTVLQAMRRRSLKAVPTAQNDGVKRVGADATGAQR
ncbi:ATP-binding cassette domain-containing protein [Acuticoccus sp.]|uniref:ATP-binding cassette domain-containing protein n=1 Tax=Acuticoccus sp. TaxID=1904378 RepID=UPI003B52B2EF